MLIKKGGILGILVKKIQTLSQLFVHLLWFEFVNRDTSVKKIAHLAE